MSSRYHGTPEQLGALNAYIKLMRATRAVRWKLGRHLESYGLTLTQLGVLDCLYHLGTMAERELRPRLFELGLKVDELLDQLERRALIRRERAASERRTTLVYLTEPGREMVEEVLERHVSQVVKCFEVFSRDERETFEELCRRLGLHSEAMA